MELKEYQIKIGYFSHNHLVKTTIFDPEDYDGLYEVLLSDIENYLGDHEDCQVDYWHIEEYSEQYLALTPSIEDICYVIKNLRIYGEAYALYHLEDGSREYLCGSEFREVYLGDTAFFKEWSYDNFVDCSGIHEDYLPFVDIDYYIKELLLEGGVFKIEGTEDTYFYLS